MKKLLFLAAAAALTLSSCSSISHTATTLDVANDLTSNSTAELNVAPTKITYTFNPGSEYKRAGDKAVIRAAVAKALEANGNADVLVAPQYEIKRGRSIKYVTVKGYPATYKNIHPTTAKEAEVTSLLNGGAVVNQNTIINNK